MIDLEAWAWGEDSGVMTDLTDLEAVWVEDSDVQALEAALEEAASEEAMDAWEEASVVEWAVWEVALWAYSVC